MKNKHIPPRKKHVPTEREKLKDLKNYLENEIRYPVDFKDNWIIENNHCIGGCVTLRFNPPYMNGSSAPAAILFHLSSTVAESSKVFIDLCGFAKPRFLFDTNKTAGLLSIYEGLLKIDREAEDEDIVFQEALNNIASNY